MDKNQVMEELADLKLQLDGLKFKGKAALEKKIIQTMSKLEMYRWKSTDKTPELMLRDCIKEFNAAFESGKK